MKSRNPKLSINLFAFVVTQLMGLGFIFSQSSQAQTAVFNFQRTIDGSCSFSNIQGGSLQLTPDRKEFISNIPATATLTCNATNVSLTLSPPEVATISAPFVILSSSSTATYRESNPFPPLINGSQITLTATNTDLSSATKTYTGLTLGSSVLRIAGSRTITVNMSARSNIEVSAGLYRFIVRFSATPQ